MLQVLGRASSINVRKVLWTCAEIGMDYEHQPWGGDARPTSVPEFLTLNPNGLVPVIRGGGFVLWESNAICRYLAAKHARVDLLPPDPEGRAIVEQWMDWQATELNDAWRYAFMALVRRSPAHADAAMVAASVASWNRQMRILDDQLRRTAALAAGSELTLADVVLGLSTHRWLAAPIERPDLPAVAAYYAMLSARPAFAALCRDGGP